MATSTATPLVTVIIPAYNAEAYIDRTIASVLRQTYEAIEVIVVDDGSADRTPQIVEEHAARDGRLRLLRQRNQGVAVARNLAISQARGSLIAPVDADDLWHPQKLEFQVAALRDGPRSVGVAYCRFCWIDEQDRVIDILPQLGTFSGDILAVLILKNVLGNASTPLIRKELLETVGGYDPELKKRGGQGCEDWKLYLALAELCDFVMVPKILVGYRRSGASMSTDETQMRRSSRLLWEWLTARHPDLPRRFQRWNRQQGLFQERDRLEQANRPLLATLYRAAGHLIDPLYALDALRIRLRNRGAPASAVAGLEEWRGVPYDAVPPDPELELAARETAGLRRLERVAGMRLRQRLATVAPVGAATASLEAGH